MLRACLLAVGLIAGATVNGGMEQGQILIGSC